MGKTESKPDMNIAIGYLTYIGDLLSYTGKNMYTQIYYIYYISDI